ncbi:MAG: isocitrate lyase/phosphoenolpyruvate mutase family protein [Tahibacter sp.]
MTRSEHQIQQATRFAQLHKAGNPLLLFNIWDAGSARACASAGAAAIATGSWSVAAAHGVADGEVLPLALVMANLQRIADSVDLPVSLDLESGYGSTARQVGDNVAQAIAHGAVGINMEDQIAGVGEMYTIEQQCERLAAARAAADQAGLALFINARTDAFLLAERAQHSAEMLDATLERASAYAAAGASGIFVPGLADPALIGKFCKLCTLPTNIMMGSQSPPPAQLAQLGVARISHGPGPYRLAMQALTEAARQAQAQLTPH